jgi:hypothetical protein
MRLIIIIFALLFSSNATPPDDAEDVIKLGDYKIAQRYGYKAKDLRAAYKEARESIDEEAITEEIAHAFENDPFKSAQIVDEAIDNMFKWSFVILRAEGRTDIADTLEFEYSVVYKDYFQRSVLGILEMGDHPPMNEWLKTAHEKIHDVVGDFICKQAHLHDIYVLNQSIPIVFDPKSYKLDDYLDHFAGHLIWGWFWEHHGFAGVVTYWTVNGACIGMTWGLGVVPFVCSPIATLAEDIMDKRIAPPMGERIWKRAQESK